MNTNCWHYAQGEKTSGPMDLKELQAVLSRISDPRNLLVWRVGFEGWQRAGNVPELAEFIDKPPPQPQASHHVENTSAKSAYGRFSRRLKAFVIDWIIIMLLLVIALFVAVSANFDRVGRVLGFTFVGVWLLYETLLVWLTGSTVGHYICNLRVVDDRTHGNVSFLKAVARLLIKSALGIYSFITSTFAHHRAHALRPRKRSLRSAH